MALSMDSVTVRRIESPDDAAPSPGLVPRRVDAGLRSARHAGAVVPPVFAQRRRAWVNPALRRVCRLLARLFVFGGAVALTAYGAYQMYKVVGVGTTTTLEWVMVVLFVVTFSWIALSFTASLVGFVWLHRALAQASARRRLRCRKRQRS